VQSKGWGGVKKMERGKAHAIVRVAHHADRWLHLGPDRGCQRLPAAHQTSREEVGDTKVRVGWRNRTRTKESHAGREKSVRGRQGEWSQVEGMKLRL
jgi:hypothetical protein